jgi:subtilase family serine protease
MPSPGRLADSAEPLSLEQTRDGKNEVGCRGLPEAADAASAESGQFGYPKMKNLFRKLPLGCALALVSLLAASQARSQQTPPIPNRVTRIPDNATRITLQGGVHPLARAEFSRGPVADSLPMDRILLLLRRSDEQEAALQSLLESQQDKSSPNYHRWLAPEEFGKEFGPSDEDIRAVTDWLSSQGFHDVRVASGRNVIEFSGNAAQVRQAFLTPIENYAVNGAAYVANSGDPQIPTALAPVISGIVSLHNFPRKAHSRFLGDVRRNPTTHKLEPLFTFPDPGGSGNLYGLGPTDFATIYNSKTLLNGGNDGRGQTIAIVGETQIDPNDVSDFRAMFGLSNNFSSSNVVLNGMDPGITSKDEESESDLDVQWSGAVAPGATVKFVVSASTPASAGIDLSALYIIEHNLADVMSESYGECENNLGPAGNAFYNSLWEQAAAQGITVVISSGDGGSAGCDNFNSQTVATHGLAVSGFASTPFNVSVGGTDFDQVNVWSTYWNSSNDSVTGASAKSYIPEIPWSDNCAQLGLTGCNSAPQGWLNIVAGSGGPSQVYSKPKWQMGVNGVPNDNHRDQPDISLFASPGFTSSFYLYCQRDLNFTSSCDLSTPFYTFHAIGGTSASAPAFAGVMALVNQYAATHGGSSRQGNPNPVLYALAKKAGASCTSSTTGAAGCIFHDVVAGNSYAATRFGKSVGTISVPCKGGTPNCSSAGASTNGVLVDPSHTTTEAWTAAAGYDMATGLGSLNVNNLATSWGTVSTIGTTTTLSLSPTTGITHGTNENVSVSVGVTPASGTGVPSGDVSLIAKLADGSALGLDQFTLTNGALSGIKTQSLPGGTYKVYAHYAGDGTNAPSDSPDVQVTVGKESSQTFIVIPSFDSQGNQTSGNANSVVYGSNYIIRIYVANSSAVASATGPPAPTCETVNVVTCPTGSVTLTANGSPVDGGTYTLNNMGYTRDLAPTLTGGTYSLVAKYSGDTSYTASTSATNTFMIVPAPTQTQVDYVPNRNVLGQTFQLEANVSSPLTGPVAYPGGTVTFYDGSTPIPGPVQITPGGNAEIFADIYNVSFASAGQHTITARYSGDANYAASNSAPVTMTLLLPTAMTQTETATTINYGQSINVTAVMTTNSKSPAITGQILFGSGFPNFTNYVTTPGTDKNGNQTLTVTATTVPIVSENIYAYYQGDANYAASSTTGDLITVNIPDFSLSPANGVTLAVTAGQSGSAQITISPLSQTPSTVNLSLTGITSNAIAGYTLSLSPLQVALHGSPATSTLSLTPTGAPPQSTIRRNTRRSGVVPLTRKDWWSFGAVTGFVALVLLCLPGRERRYRFAFGLVSVGALCFVIGCGGGGGNAGNQGGGGSSPTPTSITLTTSNAKVDQNTPFTLTAKVTGQHPLTGTVEIDDYGTAVFGGLVVTNGQTQTTAQFGGLFGVGVHQLTATYIGDGENLSSTSPAISQAITGTFAIQIQGNTGGDNHFLSGAVAVQ